ncbi:MAG: hypothetical protein ACOYL5_06970 [Phototrophicaceae bacterium]|jgi:hypothetical protein
MRDIPGFLGTSASLPADITLLAYILILLPLMGVGFAYARGKNFNNHKLVMTSVTILNWVLISWVMIGSYAGGVAPRLATNPTDISVLLPTGHFLLGAAAQLLATYLVIRMWFEKQLPQALKVKNIKLYMRLALGGWVAAALGGIAVYTIWYAIPTFFPNTANSDQVIPAPDSTEEAGFSVDVTEEAEEALESPDGTEEASGG